MSKFMAVPKSISRGRVTRFTVMSILQAARAARLGLPRDSAYSWGLNRAIFYAAAKRGFKGNLSSKRSFSDRSAEKETPVRQDESIFNLGDEKAYTEKAGSNNGPLLFKIGDEAQTPEDFQKQVKSRFTEESFRKAWSEALEIMKKYDKSTLESQRRFYEEVYKPRRDILAQKWSETPKS